MTTCIMSPVKYSEVKFDVRLQQCLGGFLIVIGLVFVVYSNRVVSYNWLLEALLIIDHNLLQEEKLASTVTRQEKVNQT